MHVSFFLIPTFGFTYTFVSQGLKIYEHRGQILNHKCQL